MVIELLAVLYPEAVARTVTVEDVRAFGFAPDAQAPDPIDNW